MGKIPKGLTDKDMFQNYVEEETLEDTFIKAEKLADKKRRDRAAIEPPAELSRAGFTPALTEDLGKALMVLKMELFREGVQHYTFKIKRDGESIVLTPKYKKEN